MDIKVNKAKPHRILVTYRTTDSQVSSVCVFSIHKNKVVQQLEFVHSSRSDLG